MDLADLFDDVLGRVLEQWSEATAMGDHELAQFWWGTRDVILAMRRDVIDHPRPVPEVTSYLTRTMDLLRTPPQQG